MHDNLPVHAKRDDPDWIADPSNAIAICYVPSDVPERNPDESVDNYKKQTSTRARTPSAEDCNLAPRHPATTLRAGQAVVPSSARARVRVLSNGCRSALGGKLHSVIRVKLGVAVAQRA